MDIVHEILDDSDRGARRLIDEYGGRLTAAAISLCSNEAEAKDLVSETVDIAVRQIGSYRNEAVLFEWLFGIMKNLYRHSRRRMSATNEIAVPNLPEVSAVKPDEGELQVLQAVDAGILRDAVNALPPDMREAVVLRYFMDMPLVQIAKFLSLPVGTVKSRLHHAHPGRPQLPLLAQGVVEVLLQALGHAIEAPGELGQFVAAPQLGAGVEVPLLHPAHGIVKGLHRLGNPTGHAHGEPEAQQQAQGDGAQGDAVQQLPGLARQGLFLEQNERKAAICLLRS